MTTTPFRSFTYDAQPFALPENVELREDLIYESASGQEWPLDLFLPCVRPHPVPAVVYLQGGGGRPGNRQQFWRHAAFLAARGIAGASIQHPFRNIAVPQAAVRWLRRSSDELGIDRLRIGAAGSSAGSYLACLLGILDAAQSGTPSKVKAVLSQKGLYGSGIARDVQYFGDLLRELSPHRHATPQTAPTLLIHAAEDLILRPCPPALPSVLSEALVTQMRG